jgi:hypothetical protein
MRNLTGAALGVMVGVAVIGLGTIFPSAALAHCDALDGPVVAEAKVALEKGDVTPVLKWVRKNDEGETRAAFGKALAVRQGGPEAREVADRYFFETLIRLHRAGEGEPFTGLKPAGATAPAVVAADRAIGAGSVDKLGKELGQAAEKAVRERFLRLMDALKHKDESVDAGRAYVAAYVAYVHFVEVLHDTATAAGAHHRHAK